MAERPPVGPTVRVRLPGPLLRLFASAAAEVEVAATDVAGMIDALDARWPGMRDRLCDSRPAIRRSINIFVDGQRASLATPLRPGTEVVIFTALVGG